MISLRRKPLVGAVLIVGIIVSAVVWSKMGFRRPEVDSVVASVLESFVCDKCGHVFEMKVGAAAAMRRARGATFCPECGEGGARRMVNSTLIELARPPVYKPEVPDEDEDDSEAKPKKPTPPRAIRQKIDE
jgi:rubredoxin